MLHALRARRAQSLAMFALAALAGLGCAAAPWFFAWSGDAVARSNVDSVPISDRIIVTSGTIRYDRAGGNPLQVLRGQVEQNLPIDGAQTEYGARLTVAALPASKPEPTEPEPTEPEPTEPEPGEPTTPPPPAAVSSVTMMLVYRDGVCAQVTVVAGRCPQQAGEVALAGRVAEQLGVGVGDALDIDALRLLDEITLVVAGIYEVTDPNGAYWTGTELLPAIHTGDARLPSPALVSEQTLLDLPIDTMELDAHLLVPGAAFVDPSTDLRRTLDRGGPELAKSGFALTTSIPVVLDRIDRDRWLVTLGVGVGAAQLVLVCWVGLFLAVRHTSQEWRGDIGLLKLRGATTRRLWLLVGLQSGLPMLVGTMLGALVGFAAAAGLAAGVLPSSTGPAWLDIVRTVGTDPLDSLWFSLAAAAAAGLGGLVAAVAAEWRTIRTPVVDLLRRVPARHRGWRADAIDLVVVTLAAAGIYQGRAEARAGQSDASVFALLAPALVGLAAALLVARALPPVAARVGGSALRAGRPGVALAALHLARRQGVHRIFAVLAVAASVFTTTTILWYSASTAWQQRAVQELGADRVLTVETRSAAALLDAVRSVDPQGRYAMAVASTQGLRTEARVIALDATRYGQVGRLPAGLPSAADLAARLRPPATAPPAVVDGPLALDLTAPELPAGEPAPGAGAGTPPTEPELGLRLHLSTVDGEPVSAEFADLAPGRQTVEVTVQGCATGCRLVSFEVLTPYPAAPVTVELHGLRQGAGPVVSGAEFGDMTRWRTIQLPNKLPPILGARGDRLAITLGGALPRGVSPDNRVLPLTAPAQLPVVLAGAPPEPRGGDSRISILGGTDVAFQVVSRPPMLPHLGEHGVLVDLEYALRSNDSGREDADLQVWLTADAPESLVAALATRGVVVLADESVGGRTAALAANGPGLALRFEYFAVIVVLLLAAGVAVVGSTVERSSRAAELVALRGQGLSTRAIRVAGYAGTVVLVVGAATTGVLAALAAEATVAAGLPVFSDSWRLLPVPDGLTPVTLLGSVGVVLAVLGIAALSGAARLVGTIRTQTSGDRRRAGKPGAATVATSPPSASEGGAS